LYAFSLAQQLLYRHRRLRCRAKKLMAPRVLIQADQLDQLDQHFFPSERIDCPKRLAIVD
jgi:hypothetical protein